MCYCDLHTDLLADTRGENMADDSKRKGTLFAFFGGAPKTTGRGSRPPLEKFATFQQHFTDPTSFRITDAHDDNERRLLHAMQSARTAHNSVVKGSVGEHTLRAGHVNEARQYHAVLTKYQAMSAEDRADRVYLPQMNIFHDDDRTKFRRPDLLKLKRTRASSGGESFHATAIEFKTSARAPEQRRETARLLSEPAKLRAAHESTPPSRTPEHQIFHFRDVPITRYKTRFSGAAPVTTETLSAAERGGLERARIRVSHKVDRSKI